MKKRMAVVIGALLAIAFACCFIFTTPSAPKNTPRFVPGRSAAVGSYQRVDYNWLATRPFVGERTWVWVVGQTNRHCYLYDLKTRETLGELLNAGVILGNGDGTKLLCEGPGASLFVVRDWVVRFVERLSGGAISPQFNRAESLWFLDLEQNIAKPVGGIFQISGTGSRWYQSPSGRFAGTTPTTEFGRAFVFFDFSKDKLARVSIGGRVYGWWNEQSILLKSKAGDFVLYDVVTKQTTILFSREQISSAFEQFELPKDQLAQVKAVAHWSGVEYDFYFEAENAELSGQPGFLLKAQRSSPKPTLRLVSRNFEFAWGGYLDSQATRYLYQGEKGAPGSGGNGAVLMRDLNDGAVRTLVPPDSKGQYAIPRFYGDEVIYFRDHIVWRIGLDGSNNVPLFRPKPD